jgi:tripartite-type tricarboxylate transporter receptor subunit TctC
LDQLAYRCGAPAINDLVAGQVDFGCTVLGTVAPQVQASSLNALAVTSPERIDVLKDIPTTKEAGLPSFQAMTCAAIFAPKDLPPAIQSKLTNIMHWPKRSTTRQRASD